MCKCVTKISPFCSYKSVRFVANENTQRQTAARTDIAVITDTRFETETCTDRSLLTLVIPNNFGAPSVHKTPLVNFNGINCAQINSIFLFLGWSPILLKFYNLSQILLLRSGSALYHTPNTKHRAQKWAKETIWSRMGISTNTGKNVWRHGSISQRANCADAKRARYALLSNLMGLTALRSDEGRSGSPASRQRSAASGRALSVAAIQPQTASRSRIHHRRA
jgi:hypothetical protein